MEGLDDRVMLSATAGAFPIGHTLEVVATQPGVSIEFIGDKHPGQLDVVQLVGNKDVLLGHFPSSSINDVEVNLVSSDTVTVDDSLGYPFDKGTTIKVTGTGPGNSLTLKGSATLSGPLANEIYLPGSPGFDTTLFFGPASFSGPPAGTKYNLDPTVSLTDLIKTTGTLDVQTSSGKVSLSGSNGVTQTLSGLAGSVAGGSGDTLTYSNKSLVQLDLYGVNADVTLDATAAAAGERSFTLELNDPSVNDSVAIEATPSTLKTNVIANGNNAVVNVEANSAPVLIAGNSSTTVDLGEVVFSGDLLATVTAGIKANVSVSNVGLLTVDDHNNDTTQENVKVTESTISGTGLFGNNAVVVNYKGLGKVQFLAGEFGEKYAVGGSTPTAAFSTEIEIDGSADGALTVSADMDSNTNLDLVLKNASKADNSATLVFFAPGAAISPTRNPFSENGAPDLTGGAEASFLNGGHSNVDFTDFSTVVLDNRIPVE
jgi:hypothetical protein